MLTPNVAFVCIPTFPQAVFPEQRQYILTTSTGAFAGAEAGW
jgi:hypothetical protein